ncbi:glutamic-type intramembrane protease PrsW [Brevibacillus ginsengisoli]|uniref:glutamic-type intramembrane protease PrsW n=1 Tax=Brevibacillus ginsengisoli TaxID=363854 RepID=UPI003CE7E229
MIALIGAAIAPGIALLCYFYLRDSLEPEPISMVVRSFIFGILLVFPIMMLQYVIHNEWELNHPWFQAIISSALIEEFFKWLVVYHTAYKHVEFDEPYDGIVYGVAVSLGFATLENIFYLYLNGVDVAIWRAFLPVSSHALFGVWMGFYMGIGKFTKHSGKKIFMLVISLLLPILLHGFYNLILLSSQYWLWFIIPFMLILWWIGLRKVQFAHELGSKTR